MSTLTQKDARNSARSEPKKQHLEEVAVRTGRKGSENKDSGQLIYLPDSRASAVDTATLRQVSWPLPKSFVGVPFYDVSFRAFTASSTIEKGTPTVQQFDNRSIA
jgi:hypothetical protein